MINLDSSVVSAQLSGDDYINDQPQAECIKVNKLEVSTFIFCWKWSLTLFIIDFSHLLATCNIRGRQDEVTITVKTITVLVDT